MMCFSYREVMCVSYCRATCSNLLVCDTESQRRAHALSFALQRLLVNKDTRRP